MLNEGRRSDPVPSRGPLSVDFDRKLAAGLRAADGRRRRFSLVTRWRWTAFVVLPAVSAICWAALPWSFGIGARALIGAIGYLTLMVSLANRINGGFLSYLGLSFLPLLIDAALLIGVVSWLVLTSRPQDTVVLPAPSRDSRS
jgi:hypothetical protein